MTDTYINPYKTYGPNEEEDWHEYFKRLAEEREDRVIEQHGITILRTGHAVSPDTIKWLGATSLMGFYRMAQREGWQTKCGYSKSFVGGHVIKTGESSGEFEAGYTLEQAWLTAGKRERNTITISYARRDGGKWVCLHRSRRGIAESLSDSTVKLYLTYGEEINNYV